MNAISKPVDFDAVEMNFDVISGDNGLLAKHDQFFESRLANTPRLLEIAHALRYQVYCLERKFENPSEHAAGLEADTFDSRATHGVLFHRPTARAIGTVRMIRPQKGPNDGLPISALLREQQVFLADHVAIDLSVEISRFAISKEFRQRRIDRDFVVQDRLALRRTAMREGNLACLSLVQFLLRQSVDDGVLYWTAVMEPKLLRMLAGMGIRFTSIGSLVDHHGLRQPSFCFLPSMLKEMRRDYPHYWSVVTSGGELSERLDRNPALYSCVNPEPALLGVAAE